MIDVGDYLLTCVIIFGIAWVSQISDVLAAAFATAPVSSTVALCLWYYRTPVTKSQDEFIDFSVKIIKGVTASLAFSITVWYCASYLRLNPAPSILLGFVVWSLVWVNFA